jgi:hypothetical protein
MVCEIESEVAERHPLVRRLYIRPRSDRVAKEPATS